MKKVLVTGATGQIGSELTLLLRKNLGSASVDDSASRQEWGWKPEYDLQTMTRDIIQNISQMLENSS
ncbi:MAG: hypothetical protein ACNYWU_08745 [Desulfobacterales bacterium]